MEWYFILLIAVGILLSLLFIIFILGKFARPNFRKAKAYLQKKEVAPKTEVKTKQSESMPIGLSFDDKFNTVNEEAYYHENKKTQIKPPVAPFDAEGFNKFKERFNRKKQEQKTLIQKIRELPPELKVLLFDRGLARKDYEFKSKKN